MVGFWRSVLLAAAVLVAIGSPLVMASPPKPKAATTVVPAPPPPPEIAEAAPLPPPRIYLFRGALGPLFSTGIDKLAERFTEAGFKADVYEFTLCRLIADRVLAHYRETPAPIVLMGHSMGGLCSILISEILAKQNIPVSLVVTIDPAQATGKVPLNVERFINIYLSDNVLGGGDVVAEPGYRGHYASFDLKQNKRVTHINIEKSDDIHRQLVDMVKQLPRISLQTANDAVPLRYLVPADQLVELWDSGVRVPARAGDTLERVAAQHRVPLWALEQANKLSDNTPLAVGQVIVIPRHLLPLDAAPAAAGPPSRTQR